MRLDELNRCRDRSWFSTLDEDRLVMTNPVNRGENNEEPVGDKPDIPPAQFAGLIRIGQKVSSADHPLIGLTTKLFLNLKGQISYLAVRGDHLFGRHKMVPIAAVSDVTSLRILLSIGREQFQKLPEYRDDQAIAEEVDRALWKDEVLRNTDYKQIEVAVRDGIVLLNGYVISSVNQWRAETAVKNIQGILGVKSFLIADDKLLLKVSSGLINIKQFEGNHIFVQVQNGAVELSGKVISSEIRSDAEQYAACVPGVRGVINNITVPGIDLEPEDQRFIQPLIGERIYFRDGLSGVVRQVMINPSNLRVTDMIIQGQFPESIKDSESQTADRFAVIPVSTIRYLTKNAGFLLIDSTDSTLYQDFDPFGVVIPDAAWVPPYPYDLDDVRFWVERG